MLPNKRDDHRTFPLTSDEDEKSKNSVISSSYNQHNLQTAPTDSRNSHLQDNFLPTEICLRFIPKGEGNSVPVQAIAELYQAGGWWEESPKGRQAIPQIIDGSHAFLVAEDQSSGRLVAMGRLISDGVSDGYIQDLVVLKDFRRRGIGQSLVAALIARGRSDGLAWIGLVAAPGTEKFYDTMKFLTDMPGYQLRLANR